MADSIGLDPISSVSRKRTVRPEDNFRPWTSALLLNLFLNGT